ncbi:MAG: hypothetical protein DWG80_06860 [Chloroflexi bacterium]|nr:hypothetical protein [Chloroflexota bacterium]MQC18775.1 hypothetical protein [Chloroflexota bacterium]
MHRGSLIAGVLSVLGAVGALVLAVAYGELVSMYTAIGVVLLLNAAVRFRIASSDRPRDDHR